MIVNLMGTLKGIVVGSLICPNLLFSQVFNVRGSVFAGSFPVRNASVTFVSQTDTSKKYSAVTDTLGQYGLGVIVAVRESKSVQATNLELAQNYPNPFSSSTTISYNLSKQLSVSISIYNILGQEVRAFTVGRQEAGAHGIRWDGRDNAGKRIAPGIYFCRLQTNDGRQVKKMLFGMGPAGDQAGLLYQFSPTAMGVVNCSEGAPALEMFTVKLTSTAGTRPKILSAEFPNVVVRQDTILNFEVQEAITTFSLCYVRQDSLLQPDGSFYLNWEIYLNDMKGSDPKNITNYKYNDNEPAWSPDGRYIAFRRDTLSRAHILLYDTANDTVTALVVSDTIDATIPQWAPDSRIVAYDYHVIGQQSCTHLIDVNGANDRKLDYGFPDFFYPDSYTYVYADGYNIYRSNTDGSFNEFLLDLKTVGKNYVRIDDFDPSSNKILILADPTPQITNLLVTFSINSQTTDTVSIADSAWMYVLAPKFSHDFSKIAIVEVNYADTLNRVRRISLLDSGRKTILVEVTGSDTLIDSNPLAFSLDDKHLAFAENVLQPGTMIWWKSYLCLVDLETKQITNVDSGQQPKWNPMRPH